MDYMLCIKDVCQTATITYIPEAANPVASLLGVVVLLAVAGFAMVALYAYLEKKKKRMAMLQQKLKLTNEEYELLRGAL